ncbi:MAG: hypothetical protein ACD_64C00336G0002 [uncultured bacterium]|nr:MAG: hypothetical protein ACD_64C00336G0002 [uncultured bacterium]HLE76369.1 type 4a pilus biogenesis protein PilO [Candidatus Babeliales bacterium]
MYFIPEKGRFYRWAAHTRPLYRYAVTLGIIAGIAATWFFLIDPWFVGLVQYEQAALNRAEQEKREACSAERATTLRTVQIDKTQAALQQLAYNQKNSDSIAVIFDTAQKTGLQINAFSKEKEKRKEWRAKQYVSLAGTGTMDQLLQFLSALADSSSMIQCKQLALQAAEQSLFSAQFQLECVSVIA